MSVDLEIPVSPDQEDAILDHVFERKELGVVADEKAWMLSHARKKYPGCKILSADLDIKRLVWTLVVEPKV